MKNLQPHIDKLKEMTKVKDQDFSELAAYFLDHIGENSEALELSEPHEDKIGFYEAMLNALLSDKYDGAKVQTLMLLRVGDSSLVHGIVFTKGSPPIMIYYFEDIQMGLAIVTSIDRGVTDYFRLSSFLKEMSEEAETKP